MDIASVRSAASSAQRVKEVEEELREELIQAILNNTQQATAALSPSTEHPNDSISSSSSSGPFQKLLE